MKEAEKLEPEDDMEAEKLKPDDAHPEEAQPIELKKPFDLPRRGAFLVTITIVLLAVLAFVLYFFLHDDSNSSNDESIKIVGTPIPFEMSDRWERQEIAAELPVEQARYLSLSMSEDGKVLALVSPNWGQATVLVEKNDVWRVAASGLPLSISSVATVELSGDGKTLAVTSLANKTVTRTAIGAMLLGNASVFRSYDNTWKVYEPLPTIPLSNITWTDSIPVDISFSYNGTRCAVGMGNSQTTTAEYGLGDGMNWKWDNYRSAATSVFELQETKWYDEDSRFPSSFQIDNFGYNVEMSGDGTAVIQSSEHDIKNHMVNMLSTWWNGESYSWSGQWSTFALNDVGTCDEQISDVDISSDGNFTIVSVQCLKDGQVTFTTNMFDLGAGVWPYSPVAEPIVRQGDAGFLTPFSITLSGDAKTLVVAGNGVLEIFAVTSKDNGGAFTWESVDTVVADGAEFAVALSEDGSRLALATMSRGGSAFGIYQKRGV